jgi:hypothetical protein
LVTLKGTGGRVSYVPIPTAEAQERTYVESGSINETYVTYDYNHELLPWVQTMRRFVYDTLMQFKASPKKYATIYPPCLLRVPGVPLKKITVRFQDLVCMESIHAESARLNPMVIATFTRINSYKSDAYQLYRKYSSYEVAEAGEGLDSRLGWMLMYARPVFLAITKNMAGFVAEVYGALNLDTGVSMKLFKVFCSGRPFSEKDEGRIRLFILNLERIIRTIHIVRSAGLCTEFYEIYHGRVDDYIRRRLVRSAQEK